MKNGQPSLVRRMVASTVAYGTGVIALLVLAIFAGFWSGDKAAQAGADTIATWIVLVADFVAFSAVLWHLLYTTLMLGHTGPHYRHETRWSLTALNLCLYVMAASIACLDH